MKGTAVRHIQEALAAPYFYPNKKAKNHGIDGYYGPDTADAVRRFQLMNGLSADGIYGPKTKAKLESLLN
ncbi:N-acetylmuramoyl-L-alanine amidase [Bacillus haynesii]|nr:N-acetylmuramoyl-L-alanine amidase [Bacillus haynesii]